MLWPWGPALPSQGVSHSPPCGLRGGQDADVIAVIPAALAALDVLRCVVGRGGLSVLGSVVKELSLPRDSVADAAAEEVAEVAAAVTAAAITAARGGGGGGVLRIAESLQQSLLPLILLQSVKSIHLLLLLWLHSFSSLFHGYGGQQQPVLMRSMQLL